MNTPRLLQRVGLAGLSSVFGLVIVVVMLNTVSVWAGPLHNGGGDDDYETDEVVVKLDLMAGVTITDVNTAYGTTTIEVLLPSAGIYLLRVPAGMDARNLADIMKGDPRFIYAEPNLISEAPEADPSTTWAWGGQDATSFFGQYAAEALNLAWAQDINRGKGVVVAVLDTGVQLDHPVLSPVLTEARYDFVDDDPVPEDEFNGQDDDGDGAIDEAAGHGTHVAGIVHLVAPDAQIMPLRVLDSDGRGNIFIVAEAILYAARNGADVINLSLGMAGSSELLKEILEHVASGETEAEPGEDKYDIVIVAAAGNLNTDAPQYPAAEERVLAVTSVGPTATKSTFANYGDWIDVAAPGEGITSTFPTDGFARWSGTSMAAPFVAGQAALIRSVAPSLKAQDVAKLIAQTARPLDALNPAFAGLLGAGEPDIGTSLGCHWADVWPDSRHNILDNRCDGAIDVRDLMVQARNLGSSITVPFDNDGDGDVDVVDLQRVAARWRMRRN